MADYQARARSYVMSRLNYENIKALYEGTIAIARCRTLVLAVILPLISIHNAVAQDDAYRLAPGDKISLSVLGQPEMIGDFVIGGEGSILLPIVGEVTVADLTLPELQKRVTEKLADGYFHQPVVSARISEMRPLYVLGDVKTPGSYQYRFGATVQSAIAQAGGYSLPEQAQIGMRTEFLLAEERVRALELTRRTLMIRRARLEAQLNDLTRISLPADLRDDDETRALVRVESQTLDAQQKALKAEVGLLEEQKPRLEAEIVGNRDQTAAEQTQLSLIHEHLGDYNQLMTNGLARRYTGIELKREEARNKGNIARLASELARLEINIGDLSVRVLEARNSYKRRVMVELQDVRSRLAEVETTLPTAREVREARVQQGGKLGTSAGKEMGRSAFVTGRKKGKLETVRVTLSTALAPGEIVEIRRDATTDESFSQNGPSDGLSMIGADRTTLTAGTIVDDAVGRSQPTTGSVPSRPASQR